MVSPLHVPSIPRNNTPEKAAGATQTRCLQMPGLKSFLVQVSQMSSPAEGCSVFILLGGCHCELGHITGQLAATGHGAHKDRALAIAGGERKQRSLCFQQPPDTPNLVFQGDLVKAEVSLWNKKQKGNGGPRGTSCHFSLAWGEHDPSQRWAWTPERSHSPSCPSCTLSSSELLSYFHSTPMSCQPQIQ